MPEKPPAPKVVDDAAGLGLSGDEKTLLDQIHQARDNAKVPRLKINPVLVKLARGHAEKMAKEEFKGQVDIPQEVYAWQSTGASTGTQGKLDPMKVLADAEDYPTSPKFEDVGLGIAVDGMGRYRYVVIFAKPAQQQ
jgi:hypothetical protein